MSEYYAHEAPMSIHSPISAPDLIEDFYVVFSFEVSESPFAIDVLTTDETGGGVVTALDRLCGVASAAGFCHVLQGVRTLVLEAFLDLSSSVALWKEDSVFSNLTALDLFVTSGVWGGLATAHHSTQEALPLPKLQTLVLTNIVDIDNTDASHAEGHISSLMEMLMIRKRANKPLDTLVLRRTCDIGAKSNLVKLQDVVGTVLWIDSHQRIL